MTQCLLNITVKIDSKLKLLDMTLKIDWSVDWLFKSMPSNIVPNLKCSRRSQWSVSP
jgi:hypothetical protein